MISGISSQGGYPSAIDSATMQRRKEEMFAKVDTNSDGGIDKAELQVMLDKMAERDGQTRNVDELMTQFDVNGNGSLDETEMDAMHEQFMDEMKANGSMPPPPPGDMPAEGTSETGTDLFQALLDALANADEEKATALVQQYIQNLQAPGSEQEALVDIVA